MGGGRAGAGGAAGGRVGKQGGGEGRGGRGAGGDAGGGEARGGAIGGHQQHCQHQRAMIRTCPPHAKQRPTCAPTHPPARMRPTSNWPGEVGCCCCCCCPGVPSWVEVPAALCCVASGGLWCHLYRLVSPPNPLPLKKLFEWMARAARWRPGRTEGRTWRVVACTPPML